MEKEIKEISCNVSNCEYNRDSCRCVAGHIEVGNGIADTKDETRCGTFRVSSSKDGCKDGSCNFQN